MMCPSQDGEDASDVYHLLPVFACVSLQFSVIDTAPSHNNITSGALYCKADPTITPPSGRSPVSHLTAARRHRVSNSSSASSWWSHGLVASSVLLMFCTYVMSCSWTPVIDCHLLLGIKTTQSFQLPVISSRSSLTKC